MLIRNTRFVCLCVALLVAGGADAQWRSRGNVSLEGEISPGGAAGDLMVELYDSSTLTSVGRTSTGIGGQFGFSNLATGDYMLRVIDRQGNVIEQQLVRLGNTGNHVSVRLPEVKVERPAVGTVSVVQLQRKIPKAARKQFEKGVEAAEKNKSEEAIAHFEKAIEIAPDYMEARVNLGARLLHLGQAGKAVSHLERAAELDPGSVHAFINLGVAYMHLQRLEDAERAARQARRLDPANDRARYVLALALASAGKQDEALRLLAGLQERFPRVRLAMARIYAERGATAEAAGLIREYLNDVKEQDEHRAEVQNWLARLESAPVGAQ